MGLFDLIPSLPKLPTTTTNASNTTTPYPTVSERKIYPIKSENWEKNLPYYFTVLSADAKNGEVILGPPQFQFKEFRLPINPNNITISIPFAINVLATTRGILEEHNGTVFRNISISGTTGVAPGSTRLGGFENPSGTGGMANAALRGAIALGANTLGNFTDALNNLSRTISSISGGFPPLKSGIRSDKIDELGYAQLHLLLNYFVSYSEMKKKPENTQARLVFVNQKDNVSYVCTPISFEVTKSADSPHLYNYKIGLKAWDIASGTRPIDPNNPFGFEALSNNPNLLTRIFNGLREARATISAASNSIRAIASDFNNAFNIVGETLLTVKELANFERTIADFPNLMASRWKQVSRDFDAKSKDILTSISSDSNSQVQKNLRQSVTTISANAKSTLQKSDPTNPTGTPVDGQTAAQRDITQKKSDTENPFNSTDSTISNVDLLDTYPINGLVLTSDEEENIGLTIDQLKNLTINDYDLRRRKIEEIRDAYADSRQLSDATYDAAAGRTEVQGLRRTPTLQDYLVIKAFNDTIAAIDALSATNELIKKNILDPFSQARQIVGDSGITITSATAAFSVPFPFKGTLEQLASVYLGNPDRWIDIALLNDLKPPFIDEDGFIRNFTTSGSGNTFTISDATNLFPNQEIFISSVTRREEKRKIIKIDSLGPTNFLVTVDGEHDLNQFTTLHKATMKAYLPNTINSTKVILIPLDGQVPDNNNLPDTRVIPVTMDLNKQEKLMGVDIALTDTFDLAVTNSGDFALSTGLANAIQAIKIKLAVERGQLKKHPEFGSGLPIGERLEFSAQDVKQLIEAAISSDPRFADVPDITVQFDGPVVKLNIVVRLANEGGVIPITFTL